MAVIHYKNPTDYAFLRWLGSYPESHHPLDTERFHSFVKSVARYRSKKWRSFEYFKNNILTRKPNFDIDEIENFWHRMQELLDFYETPATPTITDSLDNRRGLYQRGVMKGRRYEVEISKEEYFSAKGASAETLKRADFIDD